MCIDHYHSQGKAKAKGQFTFKVRILKTLAKKSLVWSQSMEGKRGKCQLTGKRVRTTRTSPSTSPPPLVPKVKLSLIAGQKGQWQVRSGNFLFYFESNYMGWNFFFSGGGGDKVKKAHFPKNGGCWLISGYKRVNVQVFIMSFTEQRIQMNYNDMKHITVWSK